jgi:hypothetical protein
MEPIHRLAQSAKLRQNLSLLSPLSAFGRQPSVIDAFSSVRFGRGVDGRAVHLCGGISA